MFDGFFTAVEKYKNKPAFIFKKHGKTLTKTYGQFFRDSLKMATLIKLQGIKKHEKVILFIRPSYEFYVFMYASIYCNLNLVLSPLNKNTLKHAVSSSGAKYVATSKFTRLLKNFLPIKNLKNIKVEYYSKYNPEDFNFAINKDSTLMTVFSGGGTGLPKVVERSAGDLDAQLKLISEAISDFSSNLTVLSLMPNFVMATLITGAANVLFFKNFNCKINRKKLSKIINKNCVTAMIASVSKYTALNKPLLTIKKAYSGGSPMSLEELTHIKKLLPNADFTYIYGCTEVPIIAKTTLTEYEENLNSNKKCVGKTIHSGSVVISEKNQNGIGKICVCPKYNTFKYADKNIEFIIDEGKEYFFTGDYGYIQNDKLNLSGRHGFSKTSEPQVFNYEKELTLTKDYVLKRCVYIFYDNKEYLITEKASKKQLQAIKTDYTNLQVINTKKIPLEKRHNSKPHFEKCINLLLKK